MRLLILCALAAFSLQAQPWEKPSPSEGLVVWRNTAPVFDAAEETRLEAVLQAINDTTSTQIAVLFVDRVNDDLNFVAAQTGEAWGHRPSRNRQRNARAYRTRRPKDGDPSWTRP